VVDRHAAAVLLSATSLPMCSCYGEQCARYRPGHGLGVWRKDTSDAVLEAARLARAAGRPVKVVWTREEEFTWAYFRPLVSSKSKSGVASDGMLTAWDFSQLPFRDVRDRHAYAAANQRTEYHPVP